MSRPHTRPASAPRASARRDDDQSLAVRAAWLHHAAGMTQSEVANRLGVTNVKAHRLIMWANQNGLVKVTIDGDIAELALLETQLSERFGLSFCQLAPDLNEPGLPLRALGIAGSSFLRREIANLQGGVIGIGHGRTLAAAVADLPRMDAGNVRFVSLLGGLTRHHAANPYDVMHQLAQKTGATAYVLPVPFFANTAEDREVFLSQRGVGDVFALAEKSDLMLVGIGTAALDSQLVVSRIVEADEIKQVEELGGAGEVLGHFFDDDGRPVETPLSARTVAPGFEGLKDRRIVAIAGGRDKVRAIRAALKSGILSGLITDEETAKRLAEETPA